MLDTFIVPLTGLLAADSGHPNAGTNLAHSQNRQLNIE
jgi:hypothetical protein